MWHLWVRRSSNAVDIFASAAGQRMPACAREAKHACPFAEAQVGGADDNGAFIEFGEKVEGGGSENSP